MTMEACNGKHIQTEPVGVRKFTFLFYFQALTRILSSPGRFFAELPEFPSIRPALGSLLASSLFFACASLTQPHERPLMMAAILLLNAVFMCFMSAGLGYGVMVMTMGKGVTFRKFFSVYAFATGITLLAAWIPLFVWITEPWKWLLIAVGLIKGCGLRWFQAVMIMGISIVVLVLFFWSLGPVITWFKT
jgi:hypothetical protein